jgi:hypothetical protein
MIRSDLYMRLMLLGNGDDGRRCRDAHTEGQTIEEKDWESRQKAGRARFKTNQVPLIPASRGIITRTTYLRLLPGSPLFHNPLSGAA